MTEYVATWYEGAGYGFRGKLISAPSKESAKKKFAVKHPDKTRLLTVRTVGEFVKEFFSRNKVRMEYMGKPPMSGIDLKEWNEFMGNWKARGGSWSQWPAWIRNRIKIAALERVRTGEHVW